MPSPKVTYASFNGLSTHLVRGTENVTVFAGKEDPSWPKKVIRKQLRSRREQKEAASPVASSWGSPASSPQSSRPESPQHAGPTRVSLPLNATDVGRSTELKWTGVDVAGIDWRSFVIPPPEPPPPPPPMALHERLLDIFHLDDSKNAKKPEPREPPEVDEWEGNVTSKEDGKARSKLQPPARTLRDRIRECPNHNKSRVNDETWVRMMLQRHLRINKKTVGMYTPSEEKKEQPDSGSEDGSVAESGVSVRAGESHWEISDPKFVAEERDKLSRELRELQARYDSEKMATGERVTALYEEIRRLRRVLGLPQDSDDEDYNAMRGRLDSHPPRRRHSIVPTAAGTSASPTEADESASESPPESERVDPKAKEKEKKEHGRRREEPSQQVKTENDLLWAERQLGFMGVHRGNANARKKDIEDHIQMLWREGRRREASDANTAMEILCAHTSKSLQDVAWAEQRLGHLGVTLYNVDLRSDVLSKEVDSLKTEGKASEAADIVQAANTLETYLREKLSSAVMSLAQHDVTEENFLSKRGIIYKHAMDVRERGNVRKADDMLDAYTHLRRRRKAQVVMGNHVLAGVGIHMDQPLDSKHLKAKRIINSKHADGELGEAMALEKAVKAIEIQQEDARRWAQAVLKSRGIMAYSHARGKEATAAANGLRIAGKKKEAAELDLANTVLDKPSGGHDMELLESDREGDDEEDEGAARASRNRSETLKREVQRLLSEGIYSTYVSPAGRTFYVHNKDGKVVHDLEAIAAANLDKRSEVREEEEEEEDVVSDSPGRMEVPFTKLVQEELAKLRDTDIPEEEKAILSRQRARERLDMRRRRGNSGIQPALGDTAVGVMTPSDAPHSSFSKSFNRSFTKESIMKEAQRMITSGEWQEGIDDASGRRYFVKKRTGEVRFTLNDLAEANLRQKQVETPSQEDLQIVPIEDGAPTPPPKDLQALLSASTLVSVQGRRPRSETIDTEEEELLRLYSSGGLSQSLTRSEKGVRLRSKRDDYNKARRRRLISLLQKYDPDRLGDLDNMLLDWNGDEEALLSAIKEQYSHRQRLSPKLRRRRSTSPPRRLLSKTSQDSVSAELHLNKFLRRAFTEEEFRQLLIKLYARSAPHRIRGVTSEVAQYGSSPNDRLRQLVDEYGAKECWAAWGGLSQQTLEAINLDHAMGDALENLAGEAGAGTDGQVLPAQLSPVFALGSSQAGPARSPTRSRRVEGWGDDYEDEDVGPPPETTGKLDPIAYSSPTSPRTRSEETRGRNSFPLRVPAGTAVPEEVLREEREKQMRKQQARQQRQQAGAAVLAAAKSPAEKKIAAMSSASRDPPSIQRGGGVGRAGGVRRGPIEGGLSPIRPIVPATAPDSPASPRSPSKDLPPPPTPPQDPPPKDPPTTSRGASPSFSPIRGTLPSPPRRIRTPTPPGSPVRRVLTPPKRDSIVPDPTASMRRKHPTEDTFPEPPMTARPRQPKGAWAKSVPRSAGSPPRRDIASLPEGHRHPASDYEGSSPTPLPFVPDSEPPSPASQMFHSPVSRTRQRRPSPLPVTLFDSSIPPTPATPGVRPRRRAPVEMPEQSPSEQSPYPEKPVGIRPRALTVVIESKREDGLVDERP